MDSGHTKYRAKRRQDRTQHIKKDDGKEKLSTERAGRNRTGSQEGAVWPKGALEGAEERRGDEERKGSAG